MLMMRWRTAPLLFSLRSTRTFCISNNALIRQEKLKGLLEKLELRKVPNIVLGSDEPKIVLDAEAKRQLGLFIPKSPFNPRMSARVQEAYVKTIGVSLYQVEEIKKNATIYMMQKPPKLVDGFLSLSDFINLVYKDIYLRFLLLQGAGVRWDLGCPNYGFLADPVTTHHESLLCQTVAAMVETWNEAVFLEQIVGPFSLHQGRFLTSEQVGVETIRKTLSFVKLPLTDPGEHEAQLSNLKQKGMQMNLLVTVERALKLVQPQAITIEAGIILLILKKLNTDGSGEYLLVPSGLYREQSAYFERHGYVRHSSIKGQHLQSTRFGSLPIIPEITDYKRPDGAYITNANNSLPDYQRLASAQNLSVTIPNIILENGDVCLPDGSKIHIEVPDFEMKIIESLKGQSINLMDFYGVYEDQIYYHRQTKEVVYFRILDRVALQIEATQAQAISKQWQSWGTRIQQSKVTVPKFKTGLKAKKRRALKKEIRAKLDQNTAYSSIYQCLSSIQSITIASETKGAHKISIPFRDGQPYFGPKAAKSRQFSVSNELLEALKFIGASVSTGDQVKMILEPQSATDQILPTALHLQHLLAPEQKIQVIRLHPTLQEEFKDISSRAFIKGAVKANNQEQYGYGYEAARLWICSKDEDFGDRSMHESEINEQLTKSTRLREIFREVLPLALPESILKPSQQTFYGQFMEDHINFYLQNMRHYYANFNFKAAAQLTFEFFDHYVLEIFLKTVRPLIIAYPNRPINHLFSRIATRIVSLLATISPILPFTAYHISRSASMRWPASLPANLDGVAQYNQLVRMRVQVRNRILLNKFNHATMHLSVNGWLNKMSLQDAQLFFNVRQVTMHQQDTIKWENQPGFKVQLKKGNAITENNSLRINLNTDTCIRCDPSAISTTVLCQKCQAYLDDHFEEPVMFATIEDIPTRLQQKQISSK